jgi:hypothetical protein
MKLKNLLRVFVALSVVLAAYSAYAAWGTRDDLPTLLTCNARQPYGNVAETICLTKSLGMNGIRIVVWENKTNQQAVFTAKVHCRWSLGMNGDNYQSVDVRLTNLAWWQCPQGDVVEVSY